MSAKTRLFALSVSKLPRRRRSKIAAALKRLALSCMNWLTNGVAGKVGFRLAQVAVAAGIAATIAGGIAGPAVNAGGPGSYQVNEYQTSYQTYPAVASDADGDKVIVWQSYGQDGGSYGIYGRRYNAAGDATSPEFRVNTETSNGQFAPDVAMDADGDFVVIWTGYGASASDSSLADQYAIWGQRYTFEGAPVGGQFHISGGNNSNTVFDAQIAMDADGDFVVVWSTYIPGNQAEILLRRFDENGVGAPEQVISNSTGNDERPSIAMDAVGNFVVAWDRNSDVHARRFNAAGAAQGAAFMVNDASADIQRDAAVGMDVDGDFVIAFTNSYSYSYHWSSGSPSSPSFSSGTYFANASNISYKRYNASGVQQGGQSLVDQPLVSWPFIQQNTEPSVSMDADGDFATTFENTYYSYYSVSFGPKRVIHVGTSVGGGSTGWSTLTSGSNTYYFGNPDVAMDADGDFVTVWGDYYSGYGASVSARNSSISHDGNAAPWVAGVYVAGDDHRITQGETLTQNIDHVMVTFSEDMDLGEVQDVSNWTLEHNGSPVAIQGVHFEFNNLRNRYEATLNLGDTSLEDGDYVLTVSENIQDLDNNNLDGDFDGAEDGDFVTNFTVSRQQKIGASALVHTASTSNDQFNPDVAVDADGDYMVVWQSNGNGDEIFARLFDADGTPQGGQFIVNNLGTGDQRNPAVAVDGNGNFIVAWEGPFSASYGSNCIVAQRFTPAGAEIGGEILVYADPNSGSGYAYNADVAADADGDFVVVFDGVLNISSSFDNQGVGGQRFDANGNQVGVMFRVNSSGDSTYQGQPAVAMDADGDFVVVYENYSFGMSSPFPIAPSYNIYMARFDTDGRRTSDNRITTLDEIGFFIFSPSQYNPAVAMDADGDCVVTYTHVVSVFSGPSSFYYSAAIHAQVYRHDGSLLSVLDSIEVDDSNGRVGGGPSVAMDSDGDFVITWSQNTVGYYPDGADVMARRFNVQGIAQTLPFQVPTTTPRSQFGPSVSMDNDGAFVVVWEDFYYSSSGGAFAAAGGRTTRAPSGDFDIMAQRFGPFGAPTVIGGGFNNFAVDEDDNPTVIDLSTIFGSTDPEVIYNVTANDNVTLVNAIADGSGNLTLTYLPDQNGAAVITVRATNTNGQWIEDSFTVTVNAVNDAPVLDNSSSPRAYAIKGVPAIEYEIGDVVRSSITDVDVGALEGVAIIGASGDGVWQYTIDGGLTWVDMPAVSDTNALLLDDDDNVRFVPDTDATGSALLQYRAWDQTDGNSPGDVADVTTNGGITAYSAELDTLSLNIVDGSTVVNVIKKKKKGCAADEEDGAPWGLLALVTLLAGGMFLRRRNEKEA